MENQRDPQKKDQKLGDKKETTKQPQKGNDKKDSQDNRR